MNDDRANAYIELYRETILEDAKNGDIDRTLRMLIKSVERDTRHGASKLAQECVNRIHNLEYDSLPK